MCVVQSKLASRPRRIWGFFQPRPRLPLLPARLELGLSFVQRRRAVVGASWLAGGVQRPEPAQRFGAGAGLVYAADAPLAAESTLSL